MKIINKYYPYILIIVGLIIALSFTIALATNNFNPILVDEKVRDFFYSIRGENNGVYYWAFRILTEFGYLYAIILIVLAAGILFKGDIRSAVLGIGSLSVWLLNTAIKHIFDRERPFEELRWMNETSSSFPSGHSMSATFIYGMLIYYILKSKLKKCPKIIMSLIFSLIVIIVMISRLVLGVHYFSDVVTGFSLGLVCVGVGILLDKTLVSHNFKFIKGIIERKKNKNIA